MKTWAALGLLGAAVTGCGPDVLAYDDFTFNDGEWTLEQLTSDPTFRLAEESTYDGPAVCGSDRGFSGATEPWRFVAPRRYTGNAGRFYGRRVTWDSQTAEGRQASGNDLFMSGRGIALVVRVPNNSMSTSWTTFSVYLDTRSPWLRLDNNKPADESDLRSALQTLTSLRLPGEWRNGAETTCIDNVYFGLP